MNKLTYLVCVLFFTASVLTAKVDAQTPDFTYQGQLEISSAPANGNFDFEFLLFDSLAGGSQVGSTLVRNGVAVANGIFSVSLNYGSVFTGANRFLEIRVRPEGGSFTTLSPRQPLTSAPYSVKSLTADSSTSAVNATTAGTATNFTGSLSGDVTGSQGATTVARLRGRTVAATAPLGGQVLKYNSTTNQWEPDTDIAGTGGGGGTITGVTPGTGLSGGGAAGNVTLNIANGGVGTTQLADGSVTDAKIAAVSGAKITGTVANATNAATAVNATTATNATQLGGVAASQYVVTTDPRMTDARSPTAGSPSYIQNTISPQATSNFNISGNGTAGGTLSADIINASDQYNIGGARVFAVVQPNNVFVGDSNGQNNSTGIQNSFFGSASGQTNTSGNFNTFFGAFAGRFTATGGANTFVGRNAGVANTIGEANSFFGSSAGDTNTTGVNNTIVGYNADVGVNNLTYATAIGAGAVVSTSNTIVLGRSGGQETVQIPGALTVTGDLTANGVALTNLNANNIATGTLLTPRGGTGLSASGASGNFLRSNGSTWTSSALQSADVPTGSANYVQNTAVQQTASNFNISGNGTAGGTLTGNIVNATTQYNIAGGRVLSLAGIDNLFVGENAGAVNTGSGNVFAGERAGFNNTNGNQNAFFGFATGQNNLNGSTNSFFGGQAGTANTTGSGNSFFGRNAGNSNTTGNDNTIIGNDADVGSGNLSFATAIGADAVVSASNSIQLGRADGSDTVRIAGNLVLNTLAASGATDLCRSGIIGSTFHQIANCSSSLRYKSDVQPFTGGLAVVSRLRPISFSWNKSGVRDVGFGAEEVEKIEPLLTTYNDKGEIEGVKYKQITTVLVNAVKEQQAQIEAQERRNEVQQKQIELLTKAVCSMNPKAEICKQN